MKKKILSLALVLGMLLSIISSIPVSAAAIPQSLPYAFFDYEDGVNNLEGATLVDGGISGSAKCLKYTSNVTTAEDKTVYFGGSGESVQGMIPQGAKFTMSFYVKLSRALTAGNFVLKLSNGKNLEASVDATNTDWQKVKFEGKADAEWIISSATLRFGSLSAGNLATAGSHSYYIDDMEFSVSSPYDVVPGSKAMSLEDYSMDFENGASIFHVGNNRFASKDEIGNSLQTNQLVADPTGGDNTVLKVKLASSSMGDEGTVGLGFGVSTSDVNRAVGTVPPGATLTYTFRYYIPEAITTGTTNATRAAFCISHTSAAGGFFAAVPSDMPLATTPGQWHTATLRWKNTTESAREGTAYQLRFCGTWTYGNPADTVWKLASHTGSGYGDRTFYFDDFRVTIAAPVTLNDFDTDFESDSAIQVNGQNVTATEAGTDSEKAQIVADPADGTKKAMKVTLAAGTLGSASTLKFSENITTGSAVGTAVGKIPAGGKITYKFRYYLPQEMATNNPEFSVYHGTGTVYAKSTTPFDITPNQWHNATLTYENKSLDDLKVGAAQLRYCGETAGTNWEAADSGAYSIYFDNFEVVTEGPAFPESSALAFTGNFVAGQNVVFSHTFTSSDGVAADDSVVRVVYTEDGVKGSLGSCKIGSTFTVPELPVGGTLGFEVVPVDSASTLGTMVAYTSEQVLGAYSVNLTLSDISDTDGSATANVTINNQRVDGVATKAILVVVLLDRNGAIVKLDKKAITCAAGERLTGTNGELKVTPVNAAAVAKAEAYLWECTGDTPSLSNTTMREIVADKTVAKLVAEPQE